MRRLFMWGAAVGVTVLTTLALGGTAASGSGVPATSHRAPSHGAGSLTSLESASYFGNWTGFDPAVTTTQSEFESSVLGSLFDVGPHFALVPDLATGYRVSDGGLTLTVDLRHGVTYSNGDPFDSSVVAFNWKRDIEPSLPNGLENSTNWPMTSVDTPDSYTVVAHFSRVFAPVASELNQSSFALMVDPVALQKMGEPAYNITPIGAGPFEVVSDKPGSSLLLKRNPTFWKKGYPKLDTVKVETVGSDESAYDALLAGQAQTYEGLGTLSLVDQAQKSKQLKLYSLPPNSPYVIQFNTAKPPFNNILAREAIYYATDSAAIDKHLFGNHYSLAESPTGPAGLFYEPTVPGYRTYNLAKAKALVKQLGGLTVQLGTINLLLANETDEALQAEWKQAGINTTLSSYNLTSLIGQFRSGNWQAMLQTAGDYDPALGVGVGFRFGSTSPFSGVHDPKLDSYLNAATSTINTAQRAADYKQAFKYMSDRAYAVFMFNVPIYNISTKTVTGFNPPPGVGGVFPVVNWMNVGIKS
jgi:peptide/nickel transport system substrate-binding protein